MPSSKTLIAQIRTILDTPAERAKLTSSDEAFLTKLLDAQARSGRTSLSKRQQSVITELLDSLETEITR
ncbi:hypothetical protein [Marinobacter salarius]|uniref:Uncharacterized protein n=1 Tax=Marinobacter salarius TaxID=1420917 RepID=A0A1W6KFF6_9GAMM|nr:hypothetical protein [Marinobacter salarius]ARM86158.1 hypothetical protein MARSALSMR5_04138 [Marinobacter salarius]